MYPAKAPTFDRAKFIELVLYVSERSETDPKFGETKLNKLLYYMDFLAYRELGKPITGARYQKLKWGPAAKALKPIQGEMEAEHQLHIRPGFRGPHPQFKPIALRQPDLERFTPDEIAFIDQIIQDFWDLDANQVSHRSHEDVGWKLARIGEDIPYETVFVDAVQTDA
jgi:Antitoxin SocA-like, Panacea domain